MSREFRREAGDRRLSGRRIAAVIEKSEKYVRERLADAHSFTLNDVEKFAGFIGYSPEQFVARIERDLVADAEIVPLDPRRHVTPPAHDGLDTVARPTDPEPEEDQP